MSEPTKPEDRLLSMLDASKLLGVSPRRLRGALLRAHAERGNVMVRINRWYFVTESALRTLFPQIFSNTKVKVDDRFAALEQHVALLESQVNETKKTLYAARVRIRQLEAQLRPGKMPKED